MPRTDRELHITKVDQGFAITERRPVPYSDSPEQTVVVMELTEGELTMLQKDATVFLQAASHPAVQAVVKASADAAAAQKVADDAALAAKAAEAEATKAINTVAASIEPPPPAAVVAPPPAAVVAAPPAVVPKPAEAGVEILDRPVTSSAPASAPTPKEPETPKL